MNTKVMEEEMKIRFTAICFECKHKFQLIMPEAVGGRLSADVKFRIWKRWERIVDIHSSNCGTTNVDGLMEMFEEDLQKCL